MPVGFITDSFISAFNVQKDTLIINNVDTGAPISGYSTIPNDSYITQETGYGTIKTSWSHLSLSGDVTLYVKAVSNDVANEINRLCNLRDTSIYVSFLGFMYQTESIDVVIKPNIESVNLLDVDITFYGKLPYSTPIVRPGFSTLYSNLMGSIAGTPSEVSVLPTAGNSIRNREDTILVLTKTGTTISWKVISDIKDYSSGTITNYTGNITSNFDITNTACVSVINTGDGVDEYAMAYVSGANITIRFFRLKDNFLTVDYRPSVTIPYSATHFKLVDKVLEVYNNTTNYKLTKYDLSVTNPVDTANVAQDASKLAGVSALNASRVRLLDSRFKLFIYGSTTAITGYYDCYAMHESVLQTIPGLTLGSYSILDAKILEDNKLIIFFKDLSVGSGYLHYAIINFKDFNEEYGMYTNPYVVTYKVANVNITTAGQLILYAGVIQTNTAVISDNKLYMSTEAYTDFYVENNILALTQSVIGNKYFLYQNGSVVEIRIISR